MHIIISPHPDIRSLGARLGVGLETSLKTAPHSNSNSQVQVQRSRMSTEENKDVEMKDVEVKESELDPKQAQLDKDLLTFEGLSQLPN